MKQMKYLKRLVLVGLVFSILGFAAPSTTSAQSKPLNVLFIAIDDLNDWIGAMGGHPQAQTPHMDRLAARGTAFMNAHCQAPICNPARVSMISGLLPSETGIYFLRPGLRGGSGHADAETMFHYFKSQGYYLTTRGKIFHGTTHEAETDSFDEMVTAAMPAPRPKIRLSSSGGKAWDWGPWFEKDEDTKDFQTALWGAQRLKELTIQPIFRGFSHSDMCGFSIYLSRLCPNLKSGASKIKIKMTEKLELLVQSPHYSCPE